MRLYSAVGKPICWFALPIGLSFAAYAVPQEWYGHIWLGYSDVEYGYSSMALAVIYLILGLVVVGTSAVVRILCPLRPAIRRIDTLTYVWLAIVSALAALGTVAALVKIIASLGFSGAWELITGGLANELKHALYDDYSAGLLSLRYLVVLAAPTSIAIGLVGGWRPPIVLAAVANVGLMISVAMLSSRLTLIASVVVLTMTMARYGASISARQAIVGGLALVAALIVLSNSRNINYYQEQLGIESPVLAGLANTLTYLASPAHGSLVAADYIAGGDVSVLGIEASLTTNSAVLQRAGLQWWLLPYYGVILAICTLLFYSAYRSRRLEMIVGGSAASYAIWEFWRIDIFFTGLHVTWMTFGIVLPLALGLGFHWLRDRMPDGRGGRPRRGPANPAVRALHGYFSGLGSTHAGVAATRSASADQSRRVQPARSPYRGLPDFQVSDPATSVSAGRGRFGTVSEQIMAERARQVSAEQANVA
jgi:hypothetical protein